MTKRTLIFDASVIAENLRANRGRSGIYFATYNVLKLLIKSEKFDISLYADLADDEFFNFAKENFGQDIQIYLGNKFASRLIKLKNLDTNLHKSTHNVLRALLNFFIRKPLKYFGDFVRLPHFDIAFSPMAAFSEKINAQNKYILLHDAIPMLLPEYYISVRLKKHWFCGLIKYIKNNRDCKYFANSIATKNDFVKLLNVNPDDITVTLLAASDKFYHVTDVKKIAQARAKYNIPADKKYVFSLCTLEPRKNLIRAVKTFIEFIKKNNIDDMVFVLGGAHWTEFIGKLESEINDLGLYKDKIIRAGYINDDDLSALYSGAEWVVYTSQYEGFGLPPLEAMKCGCPVITSNNSSLPEVVGDAGIMIDWDSDEQHINAYEKYYFDEKFRKSMAQRGLEHAKGFSWKNTVNLIIQEMVKNE